MLKFKRELGTFIFIFVFMAALAVKAYAAADIERLMGSSRYETAVAASQKGWEKGSQYVVLATGEDFPDALSAAPLAKKHNAPILLTGKDSLNSETLQEIQRLKAKSAYIIGGTGVISVQVESQLKQLGVSPTRIAGMDRFETSNKVAERVGYKNGIFVVTGYDFQDAVSIAPIAAKKAMPIVLSPDGFIPETFKDLASKGRVGQIYVISGNTAVTEGLLNVTAITGYSAYARNINILKNFSDEIDFNKLYIATGKDYPDALAASALAAINNSAVVLVNDYIPSEATAFIGSKLVSNLYILGGEGAVSSYVESQLKSLPAKIVSVNDVNASVVEKGKYEFPKTVTAILSSGDTHEVPVTWKLTSVDTSKMGNYVYEGIIDGYDDEVNLYLEIRPAVTSVENITAEVVLSDTYEFPKTATVKFSDNSIEEAAVTWTSNTVSMNKLGNYSFKGTVEEYNKTVTLTLKVVEDLLIDIPDSDLRAAVKSALGIKKSSGKIYKKDVLKLTTLKADRKDIWDLTGLQHFSNLRSLDLGENYIEDLTPLQSLVNLRTLRLDNNEIENITPLSKLTKLDYLNLSDNYIENISPLKSLTNLTSLYLDDNYIDDYTPIKSIFPNLKKKDFDIYAD
ncbi:N-acetylmuramoyl-L-alanine amidase LytC precursor [Oxobacter pfennigii]|uniref:N-acetylmuramoyl-L-alanine amidase LytC n=1 Tax=Oxobacter pfennigii TaxID=36849 RepID=A0A0P8W7F0_9CLOT|nr:cell wall-binding repeat-containing protein [Oxobacter pfennigii]KPU43702.1 N-acetylmuramoyl-L-alanine amidase LytC precursor [Oxobacter pfennigii]